MRARITKNSGFLVCAAILFCVGLSACERPFVEEAQPEITIVSPDINAIQDASRVEIVAKVSTRFRDVSFVTINSQPMSYDPQSEQWKANLELRRGSNTFVITARDESDLESSSSATILNHTSIYFEGRDLPMALGGHTFTHNALPNEYLLVGGSESTIQDARRELYKATIRSNTIEYQQYETQLLSPRAGHTTVRMRNGFSIILGGSIRAEARNVGDLVEQVEIFNPESNEIELLPFEGQAIRRTRHQAIRVETINGDEFIYLHGGQGDIRYGDDPRLGIRDDFRIFQYRNDSLVAIPPEPFGPRIFSAMAGHSLVALNESSDRGFGNYLVSTTEFDDGNNFDAIHLNFGLTPTAINRIPVQDSFREARTEHASERVANGLIGIFGGRGFAQNTALGTAELYSAEIGRYFLLPDSPSMQGKRWDLAATKLPQNRILLTGGFNSSGNAVRSTDFFSIL